MRLVLTVTAMVLAFWAGVAHEYNRRPPPIVYRACPSQGVYKPVSCMEQLGICQGQKRTHAVKGP